MLDSRLRPILERAFAATATRLADAGVTANQVTITGFALGLSAATAIAAGFNLAACLLFLAGRLADGLDGPIARRTSATDLGGYLDIVLDFVVYAAIPLAFAWSSPHANALAAAFLLAAIVANGAAFLAFAVMAEKRRLTTRAQGDKSLYFIAGLAEGTETVVAYTLFCLTPSLFTQLATAFALLCVASAIGRIAIAIRHLAPPPG